MSHSRVSLIVQPGDSFFPIVEAIDAARATLNLTIFRMDDPVIQQALLEAVKRGVRVRALVAKHPRGWVKENKKLLKDLSKRGVMTKTPAADTVKKRYHYKILTVDTEQSLVLTFNPTRENLHYTRDYGVVVRDPHVTSELNRLFEADWSDASFSPDETAPLAISPYNSRARVLAFIDSARKSVHISDAKLEDRQVLDLLRKKAAAGLDVRVLGPRGAAGGSVGSDRVSSNHAIQDAREMHHRRCGPRAGREHESPSRWTRSAARSRYFRRRGKGGRAARARVRVRLGAALGIASDDEDADPGNSAFVRIRGAVVSGLRLRLAVANGRPQQVPSFSRRELGRTEHVERRRDLSPERQPSAREGPHQRYEYDRSSTWTARTGRS